MWDEEVGAHDVEVDLSGDASDVSRCEFGHVLPRCGFDTAHCSAEPLARTGAS